MVSSSNQIQADIAQTRSRIDRSLDTLEANPQASLQSLTASVTNFVRRRPLTTLGFSLFAGALLQDLLSGAQGSASTTTVPSTGTSLYTTPSSTPTYGTGALDTAADTARSVGQRTQQAATGVANTASNAASTVADTATNAASTAVDTASSAASTAVDTVSNVATTAADTVSDVATTVADTATSAASTAANTATNVASTAVDTAANVASTAVDTASNVASSVVDTAASVATTVADTATSTASRVADIASEVGTTVSDTTVSVASRVGTTLSNAGKQVVNTVSNLGTTVNQQVQQRPLTTLGVSVGLGALLQPTLAPYVEQVTEQVQDTASTIGDSIGQLQSTVTSALTLPNPEEVELIQQALVPATVERARKLTSRDLRDYLENRLEPVISQASLRAGIVTAVTDRAGNFVEQRLPSLLNRSLSGTRALVVASILGAALDAYTKAQQGEGRTTEIVRRDLAQSLTQTSTQQLQRYFPEFREQYQRIAPQSA